MSVCNRVLGGSIEGIWAGADSPLGDKGAGRGTGLPVLLGSLASQAGVALHRCVHACAPISRVHKKDMLTS